MVSSNKYSIPDGGLWYTETNPHAVIVEPFNATTAIIFIGIAAWWLIRLHHKRSQFFFLYISSWILLLGGMGGTLYHAFRYSRYFILMDWLPILLLCLMASVYMLYHAWGKWHIATTIVTGMVLIQLIVWNVGRTSGHYNVNLNYALMSIMVLFSVWIYLHRFGYKNWIYVCAAVCFFCLALFFRIIDHDSVLPQGTHFLWHVFGAGACHSMFLFLYTSRNQQLGLN